MRAHSLTSNIVSDVQTSRPVKLSFDTSKTLRIVISVCCDLSSYCSDPITTCNYSMVLLTYLATTNAFGFVSLLGELSRFEIARESISVLHELGSGNFSRVMECCVFGLQSRRNTQVSQSVGTLSHSVNVAAKFALDGSGQQDIQMLFNEAKQMSKFDHNNVVRLVGVCFSESPCCILLELQQNGDLQNYVRAWSTNTSQGKITQDHLNSIATDCAQGFAYLASLKYVHRDIAARNIVLGADGVAKIGDFGTWRFLAFHRHRFLRMLIDFERLCDFVGMSRMLRHSDVSA
jgi:serine/threonine protein kinase